MSQIKNAWQGAPRWVRISLGVFAGFLILGALIPTEEEPDDSEPAAVAGSEPEDSEPSPQDEPAEEEPPPPVEEAEPVEAPPEEVPEPSPQDVVRSALEDVDGPVEDPEVKEVTFGGGSARVIVATPEGGLDGASTTDLDDQAGAVFAAVYNETGWTENAEVVFTGGLVDSKTGQELDDAMTGNYSIKSPEAEQIDWSDQDTVWYVIDWSLYRTFAHPALKQD